MTIADERLAALQAVLFDFDGTLIDTGELILTSFQHTVRTVLGTDLSDEALMKNVGVPLLRQMEEIAPGRGEEMVRVYREHNHAHHDELARPFPGVEEMLTALRERGMPIGVVTSKGDAAVALGARMIGLDRLVSLVVTADDVTVHKPDPHPLRVAAERLGVDLGHTMYVGDSPHDMTAAVRGGAIAVAVTWGMFTLEQLLEAGADHVIAEPDQLLDLVAGIE